MPLVTQQRFDLFLSYDRTDSEWVHLFVRELLKESQSRAPGKPFTTWQDTKQIQGGQKWYDEIKRAVRRSAIFLAIVSPPYHGSPWCKEERRLLLEPHDGDLNGLKVETEPPNSFSFYRFLKIVKAPGPDNTHESFLSELENIEFFDHADKYELPLDSPGFIASIRRAESTIREYLNLLGNQRQALYIATVLPELLAEREELRNQLADSGYNIRPKIDLSAQHSQKLRDNEMENSTTAIFLVGGMYDSFLKMQMDTAQKFRKPMIFWIHPERSKEAGPAQHNLIDQIRDHKDLPRDTQVLGGVSIREMVQEHLVSVLSSSKEERPAPQMAGPQKLYLLYDTTLTEESQEANRLNEMLGTKLTEVFGERNKPKIVRTPSDGDHPELMRISNGVILFRKASPHPDEWLNSYVKDVTFSQAMFDKNPDFRAKAALVSHPERLAWSKFPVIGYDEGFSPQTLAPFLERLQD